MVEMDNLSSLKRDWALTEQAFTKLLAYLDSDPNKAGEKYEQTRRMLIKFFDWRGAIFCEELADETLNRVARKIDEGDEVRDFTNYCYGVARFVYLENLKRPESKQESIEDLDYEPPIGENEKDADEGLQYECFEGCLQTLPAESRDVLLNYYQDEKRAKIDHRKELAERLGIPLNALRSRAQRMRDRLEKCVNQCVQKRIMGPT